MTFARVTEELFSFLRIDENDDDTIVDNHGYMRRSTSFLIAMNFGNVSVRADYTRDLFGAKSVEYTSNPTGIVAGSSNMDRNGETVDLRKLRLKPGDALLVEISGPIMIDDEK